MQRIKIQPRNKWQEAVEKLGFGFHSTNIPYWNESAHYQFKMDEILFIEKATEELWEMCLEAVQYVMDNNLYHRFNIPAEIIPKIERSWREDHPSIYGRFDFGYDGKNLKLFEFNADTPTSLYEAGVVQWFWLQDFDKEKDQFNSIHEKMRDYWKYLKPYFNNGKLYFACVKKSLEDLTTVEYMRDLAMQAELDTDLIYMDDIGYDKSGEMFVGMRNEPIVNIFKLYAWEWMAKERFADKLIKDNKTLWIEPAWKMILSNKAILPILWECFPRCPYILEAYFEDENKLSNYVRKPILSREGQNISVVKEGAVIEQTRGDYGAELFICQQLFDIPKFDGVTPVLGSWIIGQQSAGMGIRECGGLITDNKSCFVPHLIKD